MHTPVSVLRLARLVPLAALAQLVLGGRHQRAGRTDGNAVAAIDARRSRCTSPARTSAVKRRQSSIRSRDFAVSRARSRRSPCSIGLFGMPTVINSSTAYGVRAVAVQVDVAAAAVGRRSAARSSSPRSPHTGRPPARHGPWSSRARTHPHCKLCSADGRAGAPPPPLDAGRARRAAVVQAGSSL